MLFFQDSCSREKYMLGVRSGTKKMFLPIDNFLLNICNKNKGAKQKKTKPTSYDECFDKCTLKYIKDCHYAEIDANPK